VAGRTFRYVSERDRARAPDEVARGALRDCVVVDGDAMALARGREWAEALGAELVIRRSPARVAAALVVVDAGAGRIRWRVRRTVSPLLVARPPSGTGRLLVAVDLADPDERALELAARLAHQRRAEVTLLYSLQPLLLEAEQVANFGSTVGFVPSDLDSAWRDSERRLSELLSDHELRGEVRLGEAPAARFILDAAKELLPDVIVLGASRHRGLLHALRRSTADEVAASAGASVLVVPRS
jgi:nucleotide-binding universal stress UspA family protein